MVKPHLAYFLAITCFAGTPVAAASVPNSAPLEVRFDGVARTGGDTRQVNFRFLCSSNGPNYTGVLSVELVIPRHEQLRGVFDFNPFEGPDGLASPLSDLQVTGGRSKADDRFSASGSVLGTGPTEAFGLDIAASRREFGGMRRLAAVLRPLIDGAGQLTWRQGNARAKGTPIVATLDLAQARAEQLRTVIGPCLTGQ